MRDLINPAKATFLSSVHNLRYTMQFSHCTLQSSTRLNQTELVIKLGRHKELSI